MEIILADGVVAIVLVFVVTSLTPQPGSTSPIARLVALTSFAIQSCEVRGTNCLHRAGGTMIGE